MRILAAYVAALTAMGALDFLWLGVIARGFYTRQLGSLMASPPRWYAAAAFYLLYPVGIVLFASMPGRLSSSVVQAAWLGGAFGFFAYGTYDLSNWATLRNWPVPLVFVDIAWGSVATSLAAAASAACAARVGPA